MIARALTLALLVACSPTNPTAPSRDSGASMDARAPDAGAAHDGSVPDSGARRDSGALDADRAPDAGGLDGATESDAGGSVTEDPNELIFDRHFRRGFTALDPLSGEVAGTMAPGFAPGAPAWELGEWGSMSSLSDATRTTLPSGAVRWEDAYGAVTVGPAGSPEADLIFRRNAYAEYGGVYRTATATTTWPHLLAQQRLSPPGNLGPGCPPLSELTALNFSVEARLLRDERHLGPGYDSNRHAASFLIYFTVQNLRDPSAPGYGDYLWFGLTPYDDRDPRPGLYVAGDEGTGKLIYNIGLTPLTAGSLSDGAWHLLAADLLPHIRRALQAAWDRGLLTESRNLADYRIGGMNIGWEIPGLNDAEMQVRNLSLAYTTEAATTDEVRYDFETDGDTEGWTAINLSDPRGGPVGGRWVLTASATDPMLLSPPLSLDAASHGTLRVTMANNGNPPASSRMQVFWSHRRAPGFSEAKSLWIDVDNSGAWSTYTLDLASHPEWTGEIEEIRIDPILYGDGHDIGLDSVVLGP